MKKTLKIISIISIVLFGIIWITSKFIETSKLNVIDFQNILVLSYLVTSLKYYQMELKDKNNEIQELKRKVERG